MFRQYAQALVPPTNIFLLRSNELAALLEVAWDERLDPAIRPTESLQDNLLNPWLATFGGLRPPAQSVRWDHLIYAYMIENTRIFEIFGRVLHEFLHGERLDIPSAQGQRWLQNTEELFYRDAPPFLVYGVRSDIRPDIRASRRNAYYRMFGMDLVHGMDDGRPYLYVKPTAANREFVSTFEQFLQEVWRAISNFTNAVGPNATDVEAIRSLAERLNNMLLARRRAGNLSREEFFFVSAMSWFHLTVETDSPIVHDLSAEAPSPAERLQKIGERVGLFPHRQSGAFFHLATTMSPLLIEIESGIYNLTANVPLLFSNTPIRNTIQEIITPWSLATGRNIKGLPVAASPTTLPVAASPAIPASPAVSPNGQSVPTQGALVPTRGR